MSGLPRLDGTDFIEDADGVSIADALAEALKTHGACWIDGWPGPDLRAALRAELSRLHADGALHAAAVGRAQGRRQREDIRGDSTCWLDDPRCGPPARTFLDRLDAIRVALNRRLFLGLTEVEAHYAAYPPGAGYARHRDRFRDSDARVVSWVTYLNADWDDDDGGALRLYLPNSEAADTPATIDCAPIGGSVCFLSELEHEVLPARRERFSIAAWFRRPG